MVLGNFLYLGAATFFADQVGAARKICCEASAQVSFADQVPW